MDGSLLPSRCAGLGIVIRSEAGAVLRAAGFAWRHWDPGRVELEAVLAIRWVLLPALLEAKGIIIDGDAANVLDFCHSAAWCSARPVRIVTPHTRMDRPDCATSAIRGRCYYLFWAKFNLEISLWGRNYLPSNGGSRPSKFIS
ncbi:hypothetical protein KSP40_PGU017523 [Platanthera guangdongensis]|uniref:RNase H type-1 domain-containing protein n=1 Tax=Platanthera guangdongensis TaxID=2320717 RepID=A0ABR2M211_9ASPA